MTQERAIIIASDLPLTGTMEPGVHRCSVPQCPQLVRLPDDGILLAWLDEKTGHTQSWKTHVAYHTTAVSLRAALRTHGYELLMDLSDDQVLAVYLQIVQHWASERAPESHLSGPIAASTYNHRLATISSLFAYARQRRLYRGENPIDLLKRRKVYAYANAQAIEMTEMSKLLARIPRTALAGKRDYALIGVALQTAQRGQALADMLIRDLIVVGEQIQVFFPRTKGDKNYERLLEGETSAALRDYLTLLYGPLWAALKDRPVWVSCSRNHSRGEQLSIQAVEGICARRLGTSKSHVLRHTTAHALDELGVPLGEIQGIMDHENTATTGIYTKRLKKAKNKYGRDLEQIFGISSALEEEERSKT